MIQNPESFCRSRISTTQGMDCCILKVPTNTPAGILSDRSQPKETCLKGSKVADNHTIMVWKLHGMLKSKGLLCSNRLAPFLSQCAIRTSYSFSVLFSPFTTMSLVLVENTIDRITSNKHHFLIQSAYS